MFVLKSWMIILAVFFFSLNDQGNIESGFFAAMLVDILILTFKTENVFGWFEERRSPPSGSVSPGSRRLL
jgi:hypothetical protein